uniref:Uncharacterized protein n=1 Tax=Solanum tuberosum TaxID=4113 RepID=M1DVM9_SOLTU
MRGWYPILPPTLHRTPQETTMHISHDGNKNQPTYTMRANHGIRCHIAPHRKEVVYLPKGLRHDHETSHDQWSRLGVVVLRQCQGLEALPPIAPKWSSRPPSRLVKDTTTRGPLNSSSLILKFSPKAKATPRAFPWPLVMTTSREVAREGEPCLGTFLGHTALPTTGGTTTRDGHHGW